MFLESELKLFGGFYCRSKFVVEERFAVVKTKYYRNQTSYNYSKFSLALCVHIFYALGDFFAVVEVPMWGSGCAVDSENYALSWSLT